jgi:uncharacterized protein (DUF433 family)
LIVSEDSVFEGRPYVEGRELRVPVADILEQIYLTGSIERVRRYYAPSLTREHIKEAIAFAQDYMEKPYGSSSDSSVETADVLWDEARIAT